MDHSPNPSSSIREGLPTEWKLCGDLLLKNMAPYFAKTQHQWDASSFERDWKSGKSWVAQGQQGRLLGFALVKLQGDHLFLHSIHVQAPWRKKGIGQHLLGAVEDFARCAGKAELRLVVHEGNPALYWYQNRGYQMIGSPYYLITMGKLVPQG
ncbi:MAG: GNAT family N-acetyltransferase [Bacteroidota bacterium]